MVAQNKSINNSDPSSFAAAVNTSTKKESESLSVARTFVSRTKKVVLHVHEETFVPFENQVMLRKVCC